MSMQQSIVSDAVWLADQLRRGFDGDSWHGYSLTRILADVDERTAAARPLPAAHTIWEIVLHVTAWTGEVARRLADAPPAMPAEGDWPAVGAATGGRWRAALAELGAAHARLEHAVATLPPERLHDLVGTQRDLQTGTGLTKAQIINGQVQHYAYHAAQIALLKKGLTGEGRAAP